MIVKHENRRGLPYERKATPNRSGMRSPLLSECDPHSHPVEEEVA